MTRVVAQAVVISPDSLQTEVHFKDLSYSDFNQNDFLHPYKVAKILEAGRTLALKRGFLNSADILDQGFSLFSHGMHYRFHPHLWSVKKGTGFPYKVVTRLLDIGKSSLTLQQRLINKLDGRELASNTFRYVRVNRRTAKSAPLPDEMVRRYSEALATRTPFRLQMTTPEVPDSAFSRVMRMEESDIDTNRHVNNTVYLRVCFDTMHSAVKEGRLPALDPDVSGYSLLEVTIVYLQQSVWGDQLKVQVWQPGNSDRTIRFVVRRLETSGREPVICHATMRFSPTRELSRL